MKIEKAKTVKRKSKLREELNKKKIEGELAMVNWSR